MRRTHIVLILLFSCMHVYSQEICTNGIDDDGDGLIDFADYECNGWPDPYNFNTGNNGTGGTLPIGSADLNWTASSTGITGTYNPTYVIIPNPAYVNSPWPNSVWISDDPAGGFTAGNVYYKTIINIPPADICGNPIAPSYCLNFSFFCDNSVDSIWLNGVLQNLSPNPCFTGCEYGFFTENERTSTICSDWINGNNELIVKVFNIGGPGAFLAYRTPSAPPSFTGVDTIIGSSLTICTQNADPIQLNSSSNTGVWSGPGVSPTGLFTPSLLGIGSYQIKYASACATDSILINIGEPPVATLEINTNPLCSGEPIQVTAGGGASYLWSFPQGTPSSSTNASETVNFPLADTISVSVIVSSAEGCTDTILSSLVINESPSTSLTVNPVCFSRFIFDPQVSPQGVDYELSWDLGDGTTISNSDTSLLTYLYNLPGNYVVSFTAITPSGCTGTATTNITVNDSLLYSIPNVLVQNSDVGNDKIDLEAFNQGFNLCVDYTFTVYNRWGVPVFQTRNDPYNADLFCDNCFKGFAENGATLVPGVYFYVIEGSFNILKSGSITIFG
jgi:hypothetical protein